MASVVTNKARETMLTSVSGTDLKVALLNNGIVDLTLDQLRSYELFSEISTHEVTATNYTQGGISLSDIAVSSDTNNYSWYDGSNLVWNNVTLEAYGLVVYREVSDMIVCIIKFEEPLPKESINGPFTVAWTDSHLLRMIG
jgi:hypothetical protein